MKFWEREKRILERLEQEGFLSLAEACEMTGGSVATLRRDFEAIQARGLAQRTHGGLQQPQKQPPRKRYSGTEVLDEHDREKQAIAREAAAQVRPGESIFIGAGKTCNMLASMLTGVERLTVLTTSVTATLELAESSNLHLTLLGGDVHTGSSYIETRDADIGHMLRGYFFDKVFLTVEAVDLERGYMVQDRGRIALYTQLARMTRRLYLLLDSSKFDRRAFATAYPIDKLCRVISTRNMPQRFVDYYARQGISCTLLNLE